MEHGDDILQIKKKTKRLKLKIEEKKKEIYLNDQKNTIKIAEQNINIIELHRIKET